MSTHPSQYPTLSLNTSYICTENSQFLLKDDFFRCVSISSSHSVSQSVVVRVRVGDTLKHPVSGSNVAVEGGHPQPPLAVAVHDVFLHCNSPLPPELALKTELHSHPLLTICLTVFLFR